MSGLLATDTVRAGTLAGPMSGSARVPEQFLQASLSACHAQFPRTCNMCRRPFGSFGDFVAATKRIGNPMIDAVEDDDPIGMLVFFNCACGTTLALCYEDLARHADFNAAVRAVVPTGAKAQGELLARFVDQVNALARDGEVGPPRAPPPDPLLLEIGAAMVALIQKGGVVIPPFPAVAFKVVELAQSQKATAEAIARELQADAALASTVMLSANSALYSRGAPVTTLQAAVTRLGMQEVARQAMAASMGAATTSSGPLWALRCQLWHQSLVRAVVSRYLALRRGQSGDEAFLCGLLHSLGAVIGALSLEKVLQARKDFPPQALGWWSRVLEHFRVQLAELSAREWRLLPLFAEIIRLDANTDRAASAHPRMLELVTQANTVTRLLGERRRLDATDLNKAGITAEADALAKAIPDSAPLLGQLEARAPAKPVASFVAPEPECALAAPEPPVAFCAPGAPKVRYEVVGVGERLVVVEGDAPLPEMVLTKLAALEEPTFDLWVLPRAASTPSGRRRYELVPFALSQAVEHHWQRWLGAWR